MPLNADSQLEAGLHQVQAYFEQLTVDFDSRRIGVLSSHLLSLMNQLLTADWAWFDHLSCLTAIDQGPEALPRFKLVYELFSYPHEQGIEVVCWAEFHQSRWVVPSVSKLWPTAQWHEREIYDLFGIHFNDNADLRRIFMPEDWVGHPLCRDYRDPDFYHGIAVGYYGPSTTHCA